jgi:chromosome partitioning protein
MGDVELTLAGEMMRERYLADALAGQIEDYDLVLVDCPPNLGLLTVNAFCAAPEVLVVVSMTDRNAYKGALALLATVNKLRRKGVDVAVTGIVRNNVDRHRSTYRLLNKALVGARLPLLRTEVPLRAGFQNAVTAGVPLVHFSPDHIGAQAIRNIAGELAPLTARPKAVA